MSEGLFWKSVRVNKYFSLKKTKKQTVVISTSNYTHLTKKKKEKKTPSKRPLICGFSSFSLYFKHKSRSDASKSEDEVFKCTYRVCRPILAGNPVTGRRIYRLTPSISGDTELHCTRALLNLSAPHPVSTNHASPSGSLIPLSLSPARSPSLWPPPLLLLPLLQPTVQTIQPYVTDPNKVFGEGGKIACGPCGGGIFSFIIRNNIDTCAITTAWLWMKEERRTLKATGLWGSAYSKKLLASSRLLSTLVIARTCVPALIIQ